MKSMEHQKSLKSSGKRTCDIWENSRKLYAWNAYKLKDSSVIKQTGLKHVTVMRSYEDRESDTYLIAWQSENGKYITSFLNKNKKVEITDVH